TAGTSDRPANALSKYLGLAWRNHRREAIPLLKRIAPHLHAIELAQTFDDILERMTESDGAALVAELALHTNDGAQERQWCEILARRLASDWNPARNNSNVCRLIQESLDDPDIRIQGIDMARATGDVRYRPALDKLAADVKQSDDVRVAAIEALGLFPG